MKSKALFIAAFALVAITPSFAQRGFDVRISTHGFSLQISKWDDCSRWVWNEHRHRYWDGRDWRTRQEYDRLIIIQREDHRRHDRDDDWRDREYRDDHRDSRGYRNDDRSYRDRSDRDRRDHEERDDRDRGERHRDRHEYRSGDRDDDRWRNR